MAQQPEARLPSASPAGDRLALTRLRDRLRAFAAARDWEQFHAPKYLAIALSVEAAELLEHFQWVSEEGSRAMPADKLAAIDEEVKARKGGLIGCSMVSDAFFPFRDGAEVGIREGITAIVQPGGAIRDWDVIDCCNDANVAMVFTGQRSFRH